MLSKQTLSRIGVCSGCVVIALVFSMVNSTLPVIGQTENLPLSALQWMMTVFGVINCAALVTCGRLADIYGRKKIFLIGMASSLIAMVFGGFCKCPLEFIVCMAFAGIGNAIILPVSQAILVQEFDASQRSRAIALWAAVIASALAAGPVLGGWICYCFGWPWIFWIQAPVILIGIALVCLFANESKNTLDLPHLDIKGMMLLGTMIASFVLLITEGNHFSVLANGVLAVVSISSAYCLIQVEKSCPEPILRHDLLKNRPFLLASYASGALVFYIWAIFFLLPQYLQSIRGLTSLESGLLMMGITLPVAFLSPFIGKLYKRESAGNWIAWGFVLMILSNAILLMFIEETPIALILCSNLFFGIGYSFIWAPSTTASVSTLSRERAGIATGTFITIQEIGGTLGLTLIATAMKAGESEMDGIWLSLLLLSLIGLTGFFSGLLYSRQKIISLAVDT